MELSKTTYLQGMADLEAHAVADLGTMENTTYEACEARMNEIARETNICTLQIFIGSTISQKFSCGASSRESRETVYRMDAKKWPQLNNAIATTYEGAPRVFVVDGARFTPITEMRQSRLTAYERLAGCKE